MSPASKPVIVFMSWISMIEKKAGRLDRCKCISLEMKEREGFYRFEGEENFAEREKTGKGRRNGEEKCGVL